MWVVEQYGLGLLDGECLIDAGRKEVQVSETPARRAVLHLSASVKAVSAAIAGFPPRTSTGPT